MRGSRYASTKMTSDEGALENLEVVADLSVACVRYVEKALNIALDFTPDTLPLLDHYLTEARAEKREEILQLLAPSAGAYFGEVVRAGLGPCHWHWEDAPQACRLEFEPCFLSFNPIGAAVEALTGAEAPGYGAHLSLLSADQELITEALKRAPDVRQEDFYRLTTRYEVLEQVVAILSEKVRLTLPAGHRFSRETYAALREDHPAGPLN